MQHDFILLDRSGSMRSGGKWAESLGAINAYVEKLAKDGIDTGVTLATFDMPFETMEFDVLRDRTTPPTWKPVSDADATPRGFTPLNDAIGRVCALANSGGINGVKYDKLALIIVTDGLENRSRELTHDGARALLAECRAKGWQVIFLGADFDNTAQASSYGNTAGQTVEVSKKNLADAFIATAGMRGAYASSGAAMDFSPTMKAKLKSK